MFLLGLGVSLRTVGMAEDNDDEEEFDISLAKDTDLYTAVDTQNEPPTGLMLRQRIAQCSAH